MQESAWFRQCNNRARLMCDDCSMETENPFNSDYSEYYCEECYKTKTKYDGEINSLEQEKENNMKKIADKYKEAEE